MQHTRSLAQGSLEVPVVYYHVPEGESGRFAQDLGRHFDVVSDDPNILLSRDNVVLILKSHPEEAKTEFDHRIDQLNTLDLILTMKGGNTNAALVSEYFHGLLSVDKFPFINNIRHLQKDLLYLDFYAREIFQSGVDSQSLTALGKNLHIVDSDGESLRSEIISILRMREYGIKAQLDLRLNIYRLFQLIVQGANRRKTIRKFEQLGRVFTPWRILDVVIGFLGRCISSRAKPAFEKSNPGLIVSAGGKNFFPGALLRSIHFARSSAFPPDATFSVIIHILEQGRIQRLNPAVDWLNHIAGMRKRKST